MFDLKNTKIISYDCFIRKKIIILTNIIMFIGSKIVKTTYDILREVNASIWGVVEEAEKVGKIVKTGISGADVVIGTSHALKDFACNDYVCGSLDVVGSVSSTIGLVLGNIPGTRKFTVVTGSITVGCRSVRYYCKQYGSFWGCTIAAGQGIKEAIKFKLKN